MIGHVGGLPIEEAVLALVTSAGAAIAVARVAFVERISRRGRSERRLPRRYADEVDGR